MVGRHTFTEKKEAILAPQCQEFLDLLNPMLATQNNSMINPLMVSRKQKKIKFFNSVHFHSYNFQILNSHQKKLNFRTHFNNQGSSNNDIIITTHGPRFLRSFLLIDCSVSPSEEDFSSNTAQVHFHKICNKMGKIIVGNEKDIDCQVLTFCSFRQNS